MRARRSRHCGSLLAIVLCVAIAGGCSDEPTPRTGAASPEMAAMAAISEQLGLPVALKLDTVAAHEDWVFLAGLPLTADGDRIDYSQTPYRDDLAEGFFDDNFAALVRRSAEAGNRWYIVELSIGATDAPFIGWLEQHGLPPKMAASNPDE